MLHLDLLDLDPLQRQDQCRCSTCDGLRCDKTATGEDLLCDGCREHVTPVSNSKFGWHNTAHLHTEEVSKCS